MSRKTWFGKVSDSVGGHFSGSRSVGSGTGVLHMKTKNKKKLRGH